MILANVRFDCLWANEKDVAELSKELESFSQSWYAKGIDDILVWFDISANGLKSIMKARILNPRTLQALSLQ